MAQLTEQNIKLLRQKCKDSLYFFAYGVLGFSDLTTHIHKPVCEELQDFKKNTRIKVVLPRDWFKSSMCTVAYPLWRVINNPEVRILIVQNSFSNATKKLQSVKQLVEKSKLFGMLFPEIMPTKRSRWTKEGLEFNREEPHPECSIEAAGTGTATVGRHYDLIIEDDTVVPDVDNMGGLMQQPTAADIEKAIGWHKLSHPMLMHPQKSQIVIVGTRWAERDLLSWIDENAPNYLSISRAVREHPVTGKPATPERGGVAVWDRFNEEVLDELASSASIGPYMFASLYMNDPTDAVNQVFRREWIHYYPGKAPKNLAIIMSIDPASSETDQSADPDYSVILVCGVDVSKGDIYVLHYNRERYNPGALVDSIFHNYRVFTPLVVKIESIAYQRTLAWYVKESMKKQNIYFNIDEIKHVRGSKIDRIKGLQPYFSAGKIFIREHMSELEREMIAFPKAAHDDILDALTMQISFWYHETDKYKKQYLKTNKLDQFTGEAVIKSLLSRAEKRNKFPYDMGNMDDRLDALQLRDYSYA